MTRSIINKKYATKIDCHTYPRLWAVAVLIDAFFVQVGTGTTINLYEDYVVPASKATVKRADEQLKDQCTFGDIIELVHHHKLTRPDTEAGAILRYLFEAQWSTIEE